MWTLRFKGWCTPNWWKRMRHVLSKSNVNYFKYQIRKHYSSALFYNKLQYNDYKILRPLFWQATYYLRDHLQKVHDIWAQQPLPFGTLLIQLRKLPRHFSVADHFSFTVRKIVLVSTREKLLKNKHWCCCLKPDSSDSHHDSANHFLLRPL